MERRGWLTGVWSRGPRTAVQLLRCYTHHHLGGRRHFAMMRRSTAAYAAAAVAVEHISVTTHSEYTWTWAVHGASNGYRDCQRRLTSFFWMVNKARYVVYFDDLATNFDRSGRCRNYRPKRSTVSLSLNRVNLFKNGWVGYTSRITILW